MIGRRNGEQSQDQFHRLLPLCLQKGIYEQGSRQDGPEPEVLYENPGRRAVCQCADGIDAVRGLRYVEKYGMTSTIKENNGVDL